MPGIPVSAPTNALIKIINTKPLLHLPNLWAKLEFQSSMLNGFTSRALFPTVSGIPVGIIINVLVIVPGPA